MPHGHWPATQTIWDALVGARCQRDHRVALLPDVRSLRRLLGLPHPLAPTFISHTLPAQQLRLALRWVDTQPEVPEGRWFKRFPQLIVCGEGELIKTLLLPNQTP